MRRLPAVLIVFFFYIECQAQFNYAVSLIPKPLLNRAGAVIRNSETNIEVKDLADVYVRVKEAVTILNPSAEEQAYINLFYNKDVQIRSVKGVIYNEFGMPVSKFNEKSLQDRSAVNDFSLYEDNRVKYYHPAHTSYPFTIAYEYELRRRQSLFFPDWLPVGSTEVAVEKSSLNFVCPDSFKLRYKEKNFPGKAEQKVAENTKTYTWKVSNIAALRNEPYSPDYEDFLITVKLAPENFAYRGLKGSFSNWNEYGKWMYDNLLKGRDELPETTKAFVANLVKDVGDTKEKAKRIYEYMQNKTRYISVQIGIGGYQPYPAADVDRFGYGDCKGLVNYTQALLKVAGIESYYAVVYSGSFKKDISTDFTSLNQGDHIILCLPFKNDTTWLECTSKTAPFGYLGDFTDDRQVIVCTPGGGQLMRTPKLTTSENRQIRKADLVIHEDGSLSGKMTTEFSGAQFDNHNILLNEPYQEQVKKLAELYPIPNLHIEKLSFIQEKSLKPVTKESVTFKSANYGAIDSEKLKFTLNNLNRFKSGPKEIRNRTNPLYINRGYYDEDEIIYHIPAGYRADFENEKKVIEKPFGKYETEIKYESDKIIYTRKMQMNEGTYQPEVYPDFVDFFQSVIEADSTWLTLSKP